MWHARASEGRSVFVLTLPSRALGKALCIALCYLTRQPRLSIWWGCKCDQMENKGAFWRVAADALASGAGLYRRILSECKYRDFTAGLVNSVDMLWIFRECGNFKVTSLLCPRLTSKGNISAAQRIRKRQHILDISVPVCIRLQLAITWLNTTIHTVYKGFSVLCFWKMPHALQGYICSKKCNTEKYLTKKKKEWKVFYLSNIVKCYVFLRWQSLKFSIFILVFCFTWSFRTYSNILTCL